MARKSGTALAKRGKAETRSTPQLWREATPAKVKVKGKDVEGALRKLRGKIDAEHPKGFGLLKPTERGRIIRKQKRKNKAISSANTNKKRK
jgi:hypothetical protein